jgi:hypothetical protein
VSQIQKAAMSGKNRAWRKRWEVDPEDGTATHLPSGVMYCFEWDRQGKCHQKLVEDPRTLLYVQEKKRTLSQIDFAGHMNKLSREAYVIFHEKL